MSTTLVSLRLFEDFHTYVKKLSLSYLLFCLPVCLASFCGAKMAKHMHKSTHVCKLMFP